MSRSLQIFFTLIFCLLTVAPELNGVCQLCEDIRERNRQNPSPGYTYYEDYLEAQGTKDQEAQAKDKSSSKRNEDQKAPQKR